MPCEKDKKVSARCYPTPKSKALVIAGIALICVGILLVLICVPCWAWLALIGALLIILGILLVRK